MKGLEELKKEIEQIVSKITISEIEQRIQEDELVEENIEIISNDDLKYECIKQSLIDLEEEVKVWKNEILELAA